MNQRLQHFLAAEGITQSQFADEIEVAKSSVSNILAGRNNPSYDFILNLSNHYPDLSLEWVLTGKGRMYRSGKEAAPRSRKQLFCSKRKKLKKKPESARIRNP